jgi:hypothetical protein
MMMMMMINTSDGLIISVIIDFHNEGLSSFY